MPTNKDKSKGLVVNGVAEDPINKRKLPLSVDWQADVRKKLGEKK